jgi:hypothetical protein
MLNNPTVDKIRDMQLKVMAQMMAEPNHSLRELSCEERLVFVQLVSVHYRAQI